MSHRPHNHEPIHLPDGPMHFASKFGWRFGTPPQEVSALKGAIGSKDMDVTRPAEQQAQLEEGFCPKFGSSSKKLLQGSPALAQQRSSGRLLTIKQVAEFLQVPRSWVYGRTRARDHDRLPGMRLGKYWRFRESDVLAWLEERGHGNLSRL